MDATAWTVVGATIAVLVAIGTAFRSLRGEMRQQAGRIDRLGEQQTDDWKMLRERIDAQGRDLLQRIDAQGRDLLQRIDAQGQDLRERIDTQERDLLQRIDAQGQDLLQRIDAQGQDLRERIDAQGRDLRSEGAQLRERMARIEGLLEGLREAVTGGRAA